MLFICDCNYETEINLKDYDRPVKYQGEDKSPLTSEFFSCPSCGKDWEIKVILKFQNIDNYDWPPDNVA